MSTHPQVNWAGNHTYAAQRLNRPRSVEELRDVVGGTEHVRALGSRHSFSDLADTEGTLVSLLDLPADIEVDAEASSVRVSAGVTYGALATALHREGWALASMASLPHITVAGAVATGTHGSGDALGSLSSAVRAVELVGPDGELRRVAVGDATFEGHVVALGALGVVTHLTLEVEPAFEVRQDVLVGLGWDDLQQHLDAIMGSTYSVSVFTDWVDAAANQVWLKSRSMTPPDVTGVLGGTSPATETTHMLRGGALESLTAQLGEVGPWHERLPHFRMGFTPSRGAELQSEYFVPRRHASAASTALLELGERLAPLLQVSEIRSVAADQLWLSGSYDEDVVGFHFTWVLDPEGVYDVLPSVEEALAPFGARPHWGKCFTMRAPALHAVHPRMGDFARLRDEVDPGRKFGNAFMQRCLGS
ncbi:MAG: FAD-binding protein [Marmoricola sp.]